MSLALNRGLKHLQVFKPCLRMSASLSALKTGFCFSCFPCHPIHPDHLALAKLLDEDEIENKDKEE